MSTCAFSVNSDHGGCMSASPMCSYNLGNHLLYTLCGQSGDSMNAQTVAQLMRMLVCEVYRQHNSRLRDSCRAKISPVNI